MFQISSHDTRQRSTSRPHSREGPVVWEVAVDRWLDHHSQGAVKYSSSASSAERLSTRSRAPSPDVVCGVGSPQAQAPSRASRSLAEENERLARELYRLQGMYNDLKHQMQQGSHTAEISALTRALRREEAVVLREQELNVRHQEVIVAVQQDQKNAETAARRLHDQLRDEEDTRSSAEHSCRSLAALLDESRTAMATTMRSKDAIEQRYDMIFSELHHEQRVARAEASRVQAIRSEYDDAESTLSKLQSSLTVAQRSLVVEQESRGEDTRRFALLRSELNQAEAKASAAGDLVAECDSLRQLTRSGQQRISELSAELEKARWDTSRNTTARAEAQGDLQKLRHDFDAMVEACRNGEAHVEKLQDEFGSESRTARRLRSEVSSEVGAVHQQEQQLREWKTVCEAEMEQRYRSQLRQQQSEMSLRISDAQAEVREALQEARDAAQVSKEACAVSSVQSESAAQRASAFHAEVEDYKSEMFVMKERLKTIVESEAPFSGVHRRVDHLAEDAVRVWQSLRAREETLSQEMVSVAASQRSSAELVRALRSELEEQTSARSRDTQSERSRSETRIHGLERERDAANRNLSEAEDRTRSLEQRLREKTREVESLQASLTSASRESQELKSRWAAQVSVSTSDQQTAAELAATNHAYGRLQAENQQLSSELSITRASLAEMEVRVEGFDDLSRRLEQLIQEKERFASSEHHRADTDARLREKWRSSLDQSLRELERIVEDAGLDRFWLRTLVGAHVHLELLRTRSFVGDTDAVRDVDVGLSAVEKQLRHLETQLGAQLHALHGDEAKAQFVRLRSVARAVHSLQGKVGSPESVFRALDADGHGRVSQHAWVEFFVSRGLLLTKVAEDSFMDLAGSGQWLSMGQFLEQVQHLLQYLIVEPSVSVTLAASQQTISQPRSEEVVTSMTARSAPVQAATWSRTIYGPVRSVSPVVNERVYWSNVAPIRSVTPPPRPRAGTGPLVLREPVRQSFLGVLEPRRALSPASGGASL